MNDLQLIIFDCDGVLVDSEPISCRIVAEELRKLGIDISDEAAQQRFAGTSINSIRAYALEQLGRPAPEDFEDRYRRRSHAAFEEALQPVAGIKEALRTIELPRCVASNGPAYKVEANLKITGLRTYFGSELFSAYDIQRWKPEPDLYLHAARQMNTDPQHCLVVEDSTAGVQAARRAGIPVLGYAGAGNAERLQQAGATVFISMYQLPQIIREAGWRT